ncbi:uncharacterized protein [Ptychodera flava]|uniref:uncharacterized protein n=1 Tax=Ptychodera flava TaxID=63121 RepID=UPI003969C22C
MQMSMHLAKHGDMDEPVLMSGHFDEYAAIIKKIVKEETLIAEHNAEAERLRALIDCALLEDGDDDSDDDDDSVYPSLQQIKEMEQEQKQLQKRAADKMTVVKELKTKLPHQAGYTVKGLEAALATINVHLQDYHSQAFVGNHVNTCCKVC